MNELLPEIKMYIIYMIVIYHSNISGNYLWLLNLNGINIQYIPCNPYII